MFKNRSEAEGYLAGIIDGEGCVKFLWDSKRNCYRRSVAWNNTDYSIILASVKACDMIGVIYTLSKDKKPASLKGSWTVAVYARENLRKLSLLPLKGEKKQKLLDLMASYIPAREYHGTREKSVIAG